MKFYRTLAVPASDEWKVYEWKVYEWEVYEWKVYEWKVYEWKVCEWKVYELKIVWNEKQPSNVFLTKRNGKCTQPNKKVVTSDSKCRWSNVNLGYGNVAIQL